MPQTPTEPEDQSKEQAELNLEQPPVVLPPPPIPVITYRSAMGLEDDD